MAEAPRSAARAQAFPEWHLSLVSDTDRQFLGGRGMSAHLMRQSLVGLYRATPGGEVLDCNEAFAKILGWPDRDSFFAADRPRVYGDATERSASLARLRQAQSLGPTEVPMKRRDGGTVWVSASESMVALEDGSEVVEGTIVDITDRREMEARLLQVERLASVGTLAAGVAHEVNNPLSYIIANLGYAQEQLSAAAERCRARAASTEEAELAQAEEALVEARQGAERVRSIVRDLRMYAQAEDDKALVDVASLVESVLDVLRGALSKRARVHRLFQPAPPVLANEGRLRQVFLNLLLNALQALPEHDPDRNEIRVAVEASPAGRVIAEVADNGMGMAPEVQAKAFAPFFTTKGGGATGLGLAICRSAIASLGGDIELDSEMGKGTRVRVLLPAGELKPAESVPSPLAATEGAPTLPASSTRRVLVVDDDPVVGQAVRRLLRGNEVVICGDARRALGLLTAGPAFDVILCDLFMPGTSGMQLYSALQERDRDAAGRMVFMTAGAFTDESREFLDAVPNERLEKPFEAARLRALVAQAPRRR